MELISRAKKERSEVVHVTNKEKQNSDDVDEDNGHSGFLATQESIKKEYREVF